MISLSMTVLPQPLSPMMAQGLAAMDRQVDVAENLCVAERDMLSSRISISVFCAWPRSVVWTLTHSNPGPAARSTGRRCSKPRPRTKSRKRMAMNE